MSPLFGRGGDGDAGRQRTAADREAARLERERARAERAGTPPPAAPSDPLGSDPVVPEQPDPVGSDPVVPERPDPVGSDPVVPERPDPVVPGTEVPGTELEPEPEERPSGIRRVGAPSVHDLPRVAPSGGTVPQPPRRRRQGGRFARRVLAVLLILVIAAILWAVLAIIQPFHGEGGAAVRVTIPSGATAGEIGDVLERDGVVASSTVFGLRARLSGKRGDLKAGTFTLRQDMSYGDAIDALTRNPEAPPVIRVTLPEGRSIDEAAATVRTAGLRGSYRAAAARNPRTIDSLHRYRAPKGTKTLEGFLFPATYELRTGSTARDLVADQLKAFRENYTGAGAARSCPGQDLTPYDVLIVASMVEREAEVARERRLIAGVICNRLRQGIPLGIDATIRYRLDNWSRPLRQSELALDSPFNTRTRRGLPPTPIGSPGEASLNAALKPARNSYLYYVVKPCGNGAHAFSSTDAEFQRDVAAYNKKRDELGGRDPSEC